MPPKRPSVLNKAMASALLLLLLLPSLLHGLHANNLNTEKGDDEFDELEYYDYPLHEHDEAGYDDALNQFELLGNRVKRETDYEYDSAEDLNDDPDYDRVEEEEEDEDESREGDYEH